MDQSADGASNPFVLAPDLQTTVTDHTWNEIRLQSGEPSDGENTGYLFDNISIECVSCDPTLLSGDITALSLGAGGTQNLSLQAGCESEGLLYIMLGSLTGDTGFPFSGFTVPLDIDAYFTYTLTSPGAPPVGNGCERARRRRQSRRDDRHSRRSKSRSRRL